MPCLIDSWRHTHHPPAPSASSWLHSGDKNSPSSQNNLLQGVTTSTLSSWGIKIRQLIVSLFSLFACRVAPVATLPPDGFVLVRWEGGLCGGFCASLASFLRRGVLAGWQGSFNFFEISIIRYHYKMYMHAFSCKDTFSFSLRSISLSLSLSVSLSLSLSLSFSISSSSLDQCIVYHTSALGLYRNYVLHSDGGSLTSEVYAVPWWRWGSGILIRGLVASDLFIYIYFFLMYTRAFSCKDTFSFSLRSPSLSISSSSLDPCILY